MVGSTVFIITSCLVGQRDENPCACQGYIYVEADKEAHVKEAVSGLRDVFQSKPAKLVPLKEMVDAVSTSQKADPLIGALPTGCTPTVQNFRFRF